jgi:hypothetical protein
MYGQEMLMSTPATLAGLRSVSLYERSRTKRRVARVVQMIARHVHELVPNALGDFTMRRLTR